MTTTGFCALPVRGPSNAVTRFKSNRCTNVTSHRKRAVILQSKNGKSKGYVDIYIMSFDFF